MFSGQRSKGTAPIPPLLTSIVRTVGHTARLVPATLGCKYADEVPMDEHDTVYMLLFSHHEMVRDLLAGFLTPEWTAVLDLHSLEKMNGS